MSIAGTPSRRSLTVLLVLLWAAPLQVSPVGKLVQSTLIAANYSRYPKNFYKRVKVRRGSGKAIIALARKFLGMIYQMLKYKWVFQDLPNFVLAEGA